MNLNIRNKKENLKKIFGFEQYRALFANETYYYWNQLWQIVNYTKSYKQGVEIALTLLDRFELYKAKFTQDEQERQLILICYQFLKMLDKADRWEDFLKNWEIIKEKSIKLKLGSEYSNSSREFHFSRGGKEHFLRDTKNGFKLGFLYGMEKRRDLIKRKLEKSKKSKNIKNLKHEQQVDLTPEEIKERYDWLIKFFKTGMYDYDSPASRQKEQRKAEKENTIEIKK